MSSGIQYKLVNLEITPPEGCWPKIAEELDDSASGFQFPEKLRQLTATAPVSAWQKIAAGLDEEFPVTNISSKLYAAEVPPPVLMWNKIKTTLDTEHEAAAPDRRYLSPLLKYAAAAAIVAFLAFGAVQLFGPGKEKTHTASVKTNVPAAEVITDTNTGNTAANDKENNTITASTDEQEARNDAALEESKKTYAKLNFPRTKKAAITSGYRFSSYINPDDINENSNSGYQEAISTEEYNVNRYIVLMTPDGQFIRMSKKLSSLVCCVSGEEEDIKCRTQVEKWRKQLACSDASHPGNFMDILSLVGSLQDN